MLIFEIKRIYEFAQRHPLSRKPLSMWVASTENATWTTTSDIKREFASADFLSDNRVIFNIGGNKFRLIVEMQYIDGAVIVLGVYTHAEYSRKTF